MKLEIKHIYLEAVIDFLYNMSLKGKESRHRSRLIRIMQERLIEVAKEEIGLMKECAQLNENGEAIINGQGAPVIRPECLTGLSEEKEALFNEKLIIEGGDIDEALRTVKDIVLNYTGEASGREAEAYDYLFMQFETD